MKIKHSGFSLVELLVVITIVGMVSSAALLILKDTTEIKAFSYTKKVMSSIKEGIANSDSNDYMTGFVNDFGTMPPYTGFLTKDSNNSFNFVKNASGEKKLAYHRFTDMTQQVGTNFPAPFMPERSPLEGNISKVLFVGYHGGYINKTDDDALKDGWQKNINMTVDMNISIDNDNGEKFLILISGGSDQLFNTNPHPLIRKEFDFAQEDGTIENLYADDYNQSYRKNSFLISSLDIDIKLESDDVNETAIFIYSPMLYYVKGSDGELCNEKSETLVDCESTDREYIAYYPFVDNFEAKITDKNVSWHIGLMKIELYFNDNNESRLFINESGILDSSNAKAYDFNSTTTDNNITDSIFFGNISVDIKNTNYSSSSDIDGSNPFYMYAGTKIISIWYKEDNTSGSWQKEKSFAYDFKPNKRNVITSRGN